MLESWWCFWLYWYSYALNNPLRFIDPSGYYNKPSDWEREQAKEKGSYYNPYFSITNPQLAWNYHTNYTPGSGFGGSIASGTYFDWKTGKNRTVFMDVTTGRNYYKQQTGSATWWSGGEIHVKPLWGSNVYLDGTEVASNDGGNQFSWVNDDSPLVEGSGSSLRGVGGELGFDVLGSRLMVGVHIYTNEYKSAYNGAWIHTHEKYSGFNLAFGPFKAQLRYNWSNGYFENGFGLSLVNIQQNSRPTLSGISGSAYLFGGISGGINFDAGSIMKTATEVSNWYYKNTGSPWMISFH